jgi:Bacterial SH3 domain
MKHIVALLLLVLLPFTGRTQPEEEDSFMPFNPFFQEEYIIQSPVVSMLENPDSKKVVETLKKGTVVKFVEVWREGRFFALDTLYGQWLKVRTPSNKTGYVYSEYVSGTYELALEGMYLYKGVPEGLDWYGVFMRDSFSDELLRVKPQIKEENEEDFWAKTLMTDQPKPSKFLLGTTQRLKPGFCGSLGHYDPGMMYSNNSLNPGNLLSIYIGTEMGDTTSTPSWFLAAAGCGRLTDTTLVMDNYQLFLMSDYPFGGIRQDLTKYVRTAPGVLPSVSLLWYGDIDYDNKPDMILDDCPEEIGCRYSLFLSSKAGPGELVRKVCEFYLPME